MGFRTAKSYVLVIVSGIILLAALVLILMNLGNPAKVHYYWTTFDAQSVGLLMFFSAVAGVILYHALKMLWSGSVSLYRHRRQEARMRSKLQGQAKSSPTPGKGDSPQKG